MPKPANGGARLTARLPEALQRDVTAVLDDWDRGGKTTRLSARDATLWTDSGESEWLDWLDIASKQLAEPERFSAIRDEVAGSGAIHAFVLGMGGSSLCPEVLAAVFGPAEGFPRLHVLDSTDPAQVRAFTKKADPNTSFFIVSSKSGGTLETNLFREHFFDHVGRTGGGPGGQEAGSRFLAVTDPGTKLEEIARRDGFRRICHGVPGIGGRYSALSDFGMIPAAIAGIDVAAILRRARDMAAGCGASGAARDNPGVALGAILGASARSGRDKLTLAASPRIRPLGAWLEQLIAESTGKQGRAIIPVDLETPSAPEAYGNDRLFVVLELAGDDDSALNELDAFTAGLERAGHPVVKIGLADAFDVGAELFRWEFATAVAGSVIGINPFDQPDVEAGKIASRELTDRYESSGSLPAQEPIARGGGFALYTDAANAAALGAGTNDAAGVTELLRGHLDRLSAGDYFALLAYIEMNEKHTALLQGIRHAVRDSRGTATCLGFGPRFLHSTGQAYKGGPNSGVFLQVTCDDAQDLPVPGRPYGFSVVKAAQALGDFRVLAERKRRALRVHIEGTDTTSGLRRLVEIVDAALGAS